MSALSAQTERERLNDAIGTISKHVVTIHSLVSVGKIEVECGGCQGCLYIGYSIGLDELVRRLAGDGWSVTHTDRMLCPKCSDYNRDYWKEQIDQR